jgi:hypothetical protein
MFAPEFDGPTAGGADTALLCFCVGRSLTRASPAGRRLPFWLIALKGGNRAH